MRLRRRIQLLFVPFVLLLAADLAIDSYLVVERDRSLTTVETRLTPAQLALADLLQALVDQEAGGRGYLITGQAPFLGAYRDGGQRADARLAELTELLGGDPALEAGVQRVGSRVTAWRQLGAEYEIQAKQAGRDEEAVALVSTGTGTELFDAARAEIATVRSDVRAALAEEDRRLDMLRSRLTTLRILRLIPAVAFVLLAGWLLVRWIGRPLAELTRAVQAVAGGDLDHHIPSPGPPDLAELGGHVEAMRRRVLAEVDDATRARDALAKRGMIVLTLRDELAPARPDLPPGVSVASRHLPAEGVVAGDWFDVVRVGPQRVSVALVDVSGHGPEAAVFALTTKQLTLAALRSGLGPAQTLDWLASHLHDTGEKFLTGVVLEVDTAAGTLRYASAGHPPLVIGGGFGLDLLGPTGPLLGPLPGTWADRTVALRAGAFVAAYSDGVIESVDPQGNELGIEGLVRALSSVNGGDAEQIAEACASQIVARRGSRQHDDFTLVVIGMLDARR